MERTIKEKALALTKKLTLDEKIGMIHGAKLFQTAGVDRLGIPPLTMSDGPMGVRNEFEPTQWMPVGNSDDYVTYLPCNSALAATWNRERAFETGSVLGEEARGRGKDVILGPGINIKRNPLCGRNFEYFSEDPYLTAEMAVPYIRGVQQWDVAACVKHFALNSQETNRLWIDVEIDENVLREIYLPAFYDALKKGGAYTIMGAYNKIRGEHCCQSKYMLKNILREEWEYDGTVISDWGGVHDTRQAAESGLDIEMSVTDDFDQYFLADPLKKMVKNNEIDESQIDEKVQHILMLMLRLHMLDGERKSGSYNTSEHREKALNTARESVVLLKNVENRLPLSKKRIKKLLIVGDNANCLHANGGGSAEIKALYEITPLMGIKTLLGGNAQVDYLQGYIRDLEDVYDGTNWQATSLENGGGSTVETEEDIALRKDRREMREKVLAYAMDYDDIIFIGGLNHNQDSEGRDRRDMCLPYEQDELIQGLLKVNPNTVIVLTGGSPVEMGRWLPAAKAVVWGWYAGMEGGRALAEVLFGEINPSGKLPETFYKTHKDCSAFALGETEGIDLLKYKEGLFVGYRYNDTFEVEPEFCFGHGLSYTEFEYSNPETTKDGQETVVGFDLRNTGSVEGMETAQIYLAPLDRAQNRPLQELKEFTKINLQPGEVKRVHLSLGTVSENMQIRIGSSSRDIRLVVNI